MQGGRHAEEVAVRLVVVGARQPVGVAGEETLGDEDLGAEGGCGVAVGAVVDGRVQRLGDVGHGRVVDGREVDAEVVLKGRFVLCERVLEFVAFEDIVARHDPEGLVVLAL